MTGPLRVALVAASLDILGGQGVQAHALLERLRGEGHRVIFVPVNPRFPRGLRWLRRFRFLRTLVNEAVYVPSLIRLRAVDVVHVFSASYWSFLLAPVPALIVARILRKRVILNYHSGEAADHFARWGRLVHAALRLAHEIVVPSEYLQRVFETHGHRTRVVRNVVDTARFRYRERVALKPRLLSCRNLEPHYRVEDVLQAFALLRERHPDATLTIVGYGSEEARLRRLAHDLGARGIQFLGRVEAEAMPRVYDDADVFVNASVVDNQPLSILEAFAAGLPVVSTGTGDIAAMVRNGETGVIVPERHPMALADAVASLLADSNRAQQIARRARRCVEAYTWTEVRPAWTEVYRGAAA